MATNNVTVDPRNLPFILWADSVKIELGGSIPNAVDEAHWKSWAVQVCAVDGNAPNPNHFTDWREWAKVWIGAS